MPDWMRTPEQLEEERLERERQELAKRFTYKTDIWQRCTDDEAEVLDAALEQAPARERRMWNDAISLEHSSEYYSILHSQMEEQFGEERTAIILAPSEEK